MSTIPLCIDRCSLQHDCPIIAKNKFIFAKISIYFHTIIGGSKAIKAVKNSCIIMQCITTSIWPHHFYILQHEIGAF